MGNNDHCLINEFGFLLLFIILLRLFIELISGAFSCLRANFHFKRRLKAYILSMYLPSLLVVLLSWLSFWIDPESTPARTSLSILTILTITTQSSIVAKSSPAGSFTKASDVWMATCLVFVFAAFIEYSIVNSLSRKLKKSQVTIAYEVFKSIQNYINQFETFH